MDKEISQDNMRIRTMADIQLQLQNIVKLAEAANMQLAEIETMISQASNSYKTQTAEDIFSISKDLCNIIQGDMENKAYHVQALLVDELDRYKGKGKFQADNHIKKIQDVYKTNHPNIEHPIIINKEKQKEEIVQDKEVFLYKLYGISSKSS